jgi:glutathione S-transferase
MTTTLYGWGAAFGMRGPSPFVLKTDMQLQMLGVSFERAIANLDDVKKHKAPYVRDGEQIIEDSTFIRSHFEQKLDKALDEGLTAEQRGAAWAVERLLEDRLALIMISERWIEDVNFEKGPARYFDAVPEPMRAQVIAQVRGDLRQMMARHGLGRHTRSERIELAARDIAAVSDLLGAKTCLFGQEPTAVDAASYGVLSSCATRFFDSPLPSIVERHANLAPYLQRLDERYFSAAKWPTPNE